jgi:hypothetical protein
LFVFGWLVLSLSAAYAQTFYTNTDGLVFTTTNGTVTITGYIGSSNAVAIPAAISNMPVVSIGDYAFYDGDLLGNLTMTSVTMADSVTNIGDYAFFGCRALNTIALSGNLVNIGASAFSTDAYFPDVRYGYYYDSACELSSVAIPDSVTNIGSAAFAGCWALNNVSIGSGLSSIEDAVFFGCGITNLIIPDTVVTIGQEAFYDCQSLTHITLGSNLASIGVSAFSGLTLNLGYPPGSPNYACAFSNIIIPDSVTNIGDFAFYNCCNLTSVTIGTGVTAIGAGAFSGDNSMMGNGPLATNFACSLRNVSITNSVTSIGAAAFYGCQYLTNVTLGGNVGSIGDSAFSGPVTSLSAGQGWPPGLNDACSLTSVVIPDSVTNLGNYVFYNCKNLTNVMLGHGVVNIGTGLFSGLTSAWPWGDVSSVWNNACGLTSIVITDSVTNIGDSAFYNCSNLANITMGTNVASIGDSAFSGDFYTWYVEAPPTEPDTASVNLACPLTHILLPNSLISIGNNVFYDCKQLTNVTFDASLASIGSNAFGQSALVSVAIPGAVTNIGPAAFELSALRHIVISNNFIAPYEFDGCTNLASVTIPDWVTNIGAYAFDSCSNLTNVTIDSGVTGIESYAFSECPLIGAYFLGNAPTADNTVFKGDSGSVVFYLPGMTGWGTSISGLPTKQWTLPKPMILADSLSVGPANGFHCTISWATNVTVVVEGCADLANPVWQPLQTNVFTNGVLYFSDPQWTNYPGRFYRVASP